ncbi:tRNA pseudouridine(55) synthase TruB [Tissierella sp. MSJ-40]|uniref:tRNA pseudouridine synthase B n=1 Tax=Tissierella simiarum TaxID=2841534 RepID=A0ABS6E548_9FIRM|nr:tRNA pseudouridine(55) synthase TruB [Tissierella simiarum]MBU5437661.1 tRNA pseudouridine(55) synthase TruB [Tissierella simiarum]
MDGVINLFKPKGMTSHDAVSIMRRILGTRRIGHTGTLDPNAAGVLPLCIGKGTRISEYLLDVDKEYIGELTLGLETDTQDEEGRVINTSSIKVNEQEIIETFSKFTGTISQVPPMYSALKYKGKKLYELAREGKIIEREPRSINIYDIKVMNIEDNKKILFYTKCSRGTYVRTLCNDIGRTLNTYGYMSYLLRVGVGNFKIEDALSVDYIVSLDKDNIKSFITPMDKALTHFSTINVPDSFFSKIVNGVHLPVNYNDENKNSSLLRVYCKDKFIGIGRIINKDNEQYLKMDKVLI